MLTFMVVNPISITSALKVSMSSPKSWHGNSEADSEILAGEFNSAGLVSNITQDRR